MTLLVGNATIAHVFDVALSSPMCGPMSIKTGSDEGSRSY